MITPAIYVHSAVEGIGIATPVLNRFVLPLTIVVLLALFLFRKDGGAGLQGFNQRPSLGSSCEGRTAVGQRLLWSQRHPCDPFPHRGMEILERAVGPPHRDKTSRADSLAWPSGVLQSCSDGEGRNTYLSAFGAGYPPSLAAPRLQLQAERKANRVVGPLHRFGFDHTDGASGRDYGGQLEPRRGKEILEPRSGSHAAASAAIYAEHE
jgi:K+ potassium transporter